MVQVFETGNPQGRLAESLGMQLGQSLGTGIHSFFANKALDKVLSDKSLENKPLPEKLGALQQALQPYGQLGQQMFQNRMAIEQLGEQEKLQKNLESQNKIKSRAAKKYLAGEELSEEEGQFFTPQELAGLHKARQPKAPPGGLSGQPIPKDQIDSIERIIEENPDATPDELAVKMGKAGVNPAYSNPILENRRREFENKHKLLESGYKSNEKYLNDLTEGLQATQQMDMRLDQMASLKDLPTPALAATMESLGIPISLFSADAETAEKLSIDLTKNITQFYGNRILQSEFQAFLRSIPSLKNTSEGRKRIIDNMKRFNDLKRLEYNTARAMELDYESKNKSLPHSFRRQVLDEMAPVAERMAKEFAEANKRPFSNQKQSPKNSEGKITVKRKSDGKMVNITPKEGWEQHYDAVNK